MINIQFITVEGCYHCAKAKEIFDELKPKYPEMKMEEKGIDKNTGKIVVEVDPVYFRPTEVEVLVGDASKTRAVLGWRPKTSFQEIARIMAEHDLTEVQKEVTNGEAPQAKE